MYDLVIKGGRIVDGTGNPWFHGDIGLHEELIVAIGKIDAPSRHLINAQGLVVMPGIIDLHSHLDLYLLHDPQATPKVTQGVTTEVLGNCGLACAPVRPENRAVLKDCIGDELGRYDVVWDWCSLAEYLDRVGKKTILNACALVGHLPVRLQVMGMEDRPPTESELVEMKRLVAEGMDSGAFGFSTGLSYYVPESYAPKDEVLDLCSVAAQYDGMFAMHYRYMGKRYWETLEEIRNIGRQLDMRVQLSHIILGKNNCEELDEILSYLESARAEGIDITADVIPILETDMLVAEITLPSWVTCEDEALVRQKLADEEVRRAMWAEIAEDKYSMFWGWDRMFFQEMNCSENKWMKDKSIEEVASILGKEPIDVLCDAVLDEGFRLTMHYLSTRHQDLVKMLRHPFRKGKRTFPS